MININDTVLCVQNSDKDERVIVSDSSKWPQCGKFYVVTGIITLSSSNTIKLVLYGLENDYPAKWFRRVDPKFEYLSELEDNDYKEMTTKVIPEIASYQDIEQTQSEPEQKPNYDFLDYLEMFDKLKH